MKKLLIALTLCATALTAQAQTFVTIGGISHHTTPTMASGQRYNNANFGLGIERQRGDITYAAGYYRNSEYRDSFYGTVSYLPIKAAGADIGVTAGLVTGYKRKDVAPMALFTACWTNVCLMAAPPVAVKNEKSSGVINLHFRVEL